jgi:hypothetical protein
LLIPSILSLDLICKLILFILLSLSLVSSLQVAEHLGPLALYQFLLFLLLVIIVEKFLPVALVATVLLPSELELRFLNLVNGEDIFDHFSLEHDVLAKFHIGQSKEHDHGVDQDPIRKQRLVVHLSSC